MSEALRKLLVVFLLIIITPPFIVLAILSVIFAQLLTGLTVVSSKTLTFLGEYDLAVKILDLYLD